MPILFVPFGVVFLLANLWRRKPAAIPPPDPAFRRLDYGRMSDAEWGEALYAWPVLDREPS